MELIVPLTWGNGSYACRNEPRVRVLRNKSDALVVYGEGASKEGERGDSLIVTISLLALKYHRKCSEKAIATVGPRTDNQGREYEWDIWGHLRNGPQVRRVTG